MLINVFGIWMMVSNILYLDPGVGRFTNTEKGCIVEFAGASSKSKWFKERSCLEIASEINKQIKEVKQK